MGSVLGVTGQVRIIVNGDCIFLSNTNMVGGYLECSGSCVFSGGILQLRQSTINCTGNVDLSVATYDIDIGPGASKILGNQIRISPALAAQMGWTGPAGTVATTFAQYQQPLSGVITTATIAVSDPCLEPVPSTPTAPNPNFNYGSTALTGTVAVRARPCNGGLPGWAIALIVLKVVGVGVAGVIVLFKLHAIHTAKTTASLNQSLRAKAMGDYRTEYQSM